MKTSDPANRLDAYLTARRFHPEEFADHQQLTSSALECAQLLSPNADSVSPFIVGQHILNNPHLAHTDVAELDILHLTTACRNLLNVLPIDEISRCSVTVYADLLSKQDMQIDYTSAVSVITKIYIAADSLEHADAAAMKFACAIAFQELRSVGIINDEIEQAMDKRLSRETCQGLVRDLRFSPKNLQALRKLPENHPALKM